MRLGHAVLEGVALIISGKSKCSVCNEVLAVGDDIVGFSHFVPRGHRLWRQSDSAMHRSCYVAWPERPEFERLRAEAEALRTAYRSPEQIAEAKRVNDVKHAAQAARDQAHNAQHAEIMVRVRERGAACPHCGAESERYRELTSMVRARVACLACHRSCNATELRLPTTP